MTNKLETHQSETQKQASLYYKIVLFRWVTSTLIWISIIPFTDTITYGPNGLIERIYLQFFSDITVSNAVPLLDPVSAGLYIRRYKTSICLNSDPFPRYLFCH